MTVYFVENENPGRKSSGGIMSYLSGLSGYLRKRGVRTVLLGTGRYPSHPGPFSDFISLVEKERVSNGRYLFALTGSVFRLRLDRTAVIHAQRPDMLVPFLAAKKNRALVCSLHGAHDVAVFDKKGQVYGRVYRLLQSLAFRKADRLIAVDDRTQRHFLAKYPGLEAKISVIPMGIDLNRFLPMPREVLKEEWPFGRRDKVILFVGRLEREKNLPLLLDAFRIVSTRLPDTKLVLVGKGREEELLRQRAADMNLENVLFLGELANEKIPELLNRAEALVLCSRYEGSPAVIKEALACNCPVVAFDVGDVREVLEGVEGCYLADGSSADLAAKLTMVLESDRKISGRERALRYSMESVGESTLRIYESLLNRGQRGQR